MKKKTFFKVLAYVLIGVCVGGIVSCEKENDSPRQQPTQQPNNQDSLTSFTCGDVYTDLRDGSTYNTVQIGSQCWMGENLKYLPQVSLSHVVSDSESYYYVYGYDGADVLEAKATSNYENYAVLYNWHVTMNAAASSTLNPSGIRGVCPEGWHIPSDGEWGDLIEYLGGESVAGGKMKVTDTLYWQNPNASATNETNFSALPGGALYPNGDFYGIGKDGIWWSSTEHDAEYVWARYLGYDGGYVTRFNYTKDVALSVRCVKD